MTAQSSKNYFATRIVALPFQEAVERSKKVIEETGWSVMSEIDVAAAMKGKLGVDFRPYVILGICNAALAHKALTADKSIGLLMPCNVVIQEHEERIEVSVVNAESVTAVTGNRDVMHVGEEANKQLRQILEKI